MCAVLLLSARAGDGVSAAMVKQMSKNYSDLDIQIRTGFDHSELPSMMAEISTMFAMYSPARGNIAEGAIPSKMFEAAAFGRPSIVNAATPMGEICEAESLGLGVKWGDVEGLAIGKRKIPQCSEWLQNLK